MTAFKPDHDRPSRNVVAVVTGAARGLGAAVARRLAADGARVYVADIDLTAAAAFARTDPEHLVALELNVADETSVENVVKEVGNADGHVDVLVNNAGIQLVRPSAQMTAAEWSQVIGVDLNGVFYVSRGFFPLLCIQGGAIVNLSSVAAFTAMPQRLPYCAAKAGVIALTRTLAAEWAECGIRVNAVAPGYINTEMLLQVVRDGTVDTTPVVQRTALGRLGDPSEIAATISWLASDEASYITGTVITVDGGWTSMGVRPRSGPGSTSTGSLDD